MTRPKTIAKGLTAGLVGGLAASWVMNRFQTMLGNALTGAMYGAMSELWPEAAVGAGLPFGAAVWLAADEIAVPALGLSKPATEYPLSKHAYALASHLVYGVTTEVVRRVVRQAL